MKILGLGTFNYRDREGVILGFLIMLVLAVVPNVSQVIFSLINSIRGVFPYERSDEQAAKLYLARLDYERAGADIKLFTKDKFRYGTDSGEGGFVYYNSKNMERIKKGELV